METGIFSCSLVSHHQFIHNLFENINRSDHAQRGIMGNQGKIVKKQSSKIYVFLHIPVLSFIFKKKLLL